MTDRSQLELLLIEDNPGDARLLREMLSEAKQIRFVVEHAERLSKGLELLRTRSFDVVLVDLALPDSEGLGTFRAVQAKAPGLPVVVLSGLDDEEISAKAVRLGAQDYLTKGNIDAQLLVRAIRYAIERKLFQRVLSESEERNAAVLRAIPDMMLRIAADGTFLDFLPAKGVAPLIPPDQFLGKSIRDALPPEVSEPAVAATARALATGEVQMIQYELCTNGQTRHFEARHVPYRDGEVLAIVRDVSESREAADALRNKEEQLRQSQKMEAIGTLAGGVAHDFNNLLTGIIGFADLALKELDEASPVRRDIEDIKKNGERAATLTRQLLAFSRRQMLHPEVLDLNQLVENITRLLRRLIGENIELVTRLGQDIDRVEADPGQLDQVIVNLVINARDAMPDGGKLTIETANVDIEESFTRNGVEVVAGQYVVMSISDTGGGIDEGTRQRIFEPFFTTKETGKGTGLGLSTVYGIVKQSGGFVWVYSEPGLGTTFKVYLPRARGHRKPSTGGFTRSRAAPITILLVEDDDSVRTLAGRILRRRGHTVLEARDGDEGLRIVQRHAGNIDLVITDVVMPKVSGPQMVKDLQSVSPGAKVLYMSGYTEAAVQEQGFGFCKDAPFLDKPFTADALIKKVSEVMSLAEGSSPAG